MARLRVEKVQEAIKHEISKMLLHDVKDPRIQFVTVTGVELTDDMSYAKIFISMYAEYSAHIQSILDKIKQEEKPAAEETEHE